MIRVFAAVIALIFAMLPVMAEEPATSDWEIRGLFQLPQNQPIKIESIQLQLLKYAPQKFYYHPIWVKQSCEVEIEENGRFRLFPRYSHRKKAITPHHFLKSGKYRVMAVAGGRPTNYFETEIDATQKIRIKNVSLNFQKALECVYRGIILDPITGKAITGLKVECWSWAGKDIRESMGMWHWGSAESDEKGYFEVRGLPEKRMELHFRSQNILNRDELNWLLTLGESGTPQDAEWPKSIPISKIDKDLKVSEFYFVEPGSGIFWQKFNLANRDHTPFRENMTLVFRRVDEISGQLVEGSDANKFEVVIDSDGSAKGPIVPAGKYRVYSKEPDKWIYNTFVDRLGPKPSLFWDEKRKPLILKPE